MAENSAIEWTDHTFNPWQGCTKVSPGCDHCYAEARQDKRLHVVQWGPGQPRKRTSAANWRDPIRWNDRHAEFFAVHGRRQRVFCASLADVFDNEVDPAWRLDLFALIVNTPDLDWLLLTKRIGNVKNMVADIMWKHLPNVWLGATIVNQEEADRDIPKLLQVPARVRFLSMEPLLGPVDLTSIRQPDLGDGREYAGADVLTEANRQLRGCIDWVIVGGESGPNARPIHPAWARSLRDQCTAAGRAFHFKQWGEFAPTTRTMAEVAASGKKHTPVPYGGAELYPVALLDRVGKKSAGRLLDGREWNEFPKAVQ